ncbi:MAG TPA: UDP-glucose 4-epimerase GalE, partial [Alphaproteobacteria bacterium]|nr:UDP-glucose 4-epimerase GalE [Alphaproteobacteria bacterium]
ALLVTGGAGYVGSHAVVELLSRGHQVIVFDNLYQGHREAVPAEAKLVPGDLSDRAAIAAVFKAHRIDAIMHFAAHSLVGESMTRPLRYVGENVVNAVNLIEAAIENKVRKFVLSSTCAIFGTPGRVPIDEEVPKAPVNPYGEGKLAIERILHWADKAHGLRSACLRYFNASGAHPTADIGEDHTPETHLIPIALDVALGKRPHIDIYGTDYPTPDGTCVRDYIHVCDLADAHVRVLDALDERSRHYNVGIGRGYSVREVIASVRRVTDAKVPERVAPRRAGDPPVLVAAPDLIRRELGWQPHYTDIDTIVATAWKWRRAHPNGFGAATAAD